MALPATKKRRSILTLTVAVALTAGLLPAAALADVGVEGGSYAGTTEPTAAKPQSKLWHHAGSWWGVLFNPASMKFEIYRYNRNTWSWSTTGEVVDDRPTAKVDALMSGSTLSIVSHVPAAATDKWVYLHQFIYDGTAFDRSGAKIKLPMNKALEEVVLAADSTGVLWANWTDGGSVFVTHSNGGAHTNWVTPYSIKDGLLTGNRGDSSSIIAFGTTTRYIGVMWSDETGTVEEGFHFAVHADGAGDDRYLDWTLENALSGPNLADDHINLKTLNGEVFAAVKHEEPPSGDDPQISVLRRTVAGVWSRHVVWNNGDNTTRPIIEVDTTAARVHVFASGVYSGLVYRKEAPLADLTFPAGQGTQVMALSAEALGQEPDFNNVTSTKQNVDSSVGLLVLAGDDANSRYVFNYMTLGAPILPAPPRRVNGLSGLASVALSWAGPGADGGSAITGYVVTPYKDGVAQTPRSFSSAVTAQLITLLDDATPYTFTVQAQNAVGLSAASAVSAPVSTFGPPGAPTGVSATPGNALASVSWSAPASNGGSPITGYTVTASPGGMTASTTGTATNAVVSGLTNGTAYIFTVKATNLLGDGPVSAPSSAVSPLTVAGSPTGVSAVPGNRSATVSWKAPADFGGSSLTGYVVTPRVNGVDQPERTFFATATTQAINGLSNGTAYTFKVAGINRAGTGFASALSAPVIPRTVPGAPTGVAAVRGNRSATVTWNAPSSDGGSAITGYMLTPVLDGVAQPASTFASTATSQTIKLPTPGSYTFIVSAVNVAGTGSSSSPSASIDLPHPAGYWMLGAGGVVYAFGDALNDGQPAGHLGSSAAVDIEGMPGGDGYWVVDEIGRVFAYRAPHFGNADSGRFRPGEKVTSLSATPKGDGYWLFTTAGRVLAFGNAPLYGDLLHLTLNGPVLDSIATPSGNGYFMVASDGGVFGFGDARFLGSMGGVGLNAPVQSLVPDPDGSGYWLVASDGGVFAFQASFRGSMASVRLNRPITGMVPYGNGYLVVGEDGGIFSFSDKPFLGSLGANPPARPVVSVAVLT